MKKILVLGAGLVARPPIRYLLDQPDFNVTVASRTMSKAEQLIEGRPNGTAIAFDVSDLHRLEELIPQHDLAISLLPYTHHVTVAKSCLNHGKHLVTTSYVSDAMRALDGEAKAAGLLFLNEIGLDPGIDHMSAMKIIHSVQKAGGTIVSFKSYCGGLPAPEANTNPFGYKFSWSPRGVVMAGRNSARYLEDGREIKIPGEDLFSHHWMLPIEGAGDFEAYPNRDSLGYLSLYGIEKARTMFRGTLRYSGWCDTLKKIVELGFLSDKEMEVEGLTYAGLLERLIGKKEGDLRKNLAEFLSLDEKDAILDRMEWLGLLGGEVIPAIKSSPLDILANRMLAKMAYAEGERDMVILHHQFVGQFPDHTEEITSTLVDFGIPHGDTSMARTVGLPAAIGARLILQGKIKTVGVHIPASAAIYEPVLAELEGVGISFVEKVKALKK
ncbi:MAG: saccharopine dehydrogenase C-terminal domain-containing protein [bacterium]